MSGTLTLGMHLISVTCAPKGLTNSKCLKLEPPSAFAASNGVLFTAELLMLAYMRCLVL